MEIQINVNNVDTNSIAESVIEELKGRARDACKWAADELTKEAHDAIAEFYGGYSPIVYGRTHGLDSSYKRYYSNKHGNIIYGGVELTDSSSSYYSSITGQGVDNAFITSLAWFAGRHGFTEAFPERFHIHNYPPVMSPSPHQRVITKLHEVESGIGKFFA